MKVIEAIKKHPLGFAVAILLSAFIFSHGPFFLWMGLPSVLPDTFDYYNVADILLHHPASELAKMPLELPLGYPIFLILADAIYHNLLFVVLLQSLIKLLACLFLVYTSCKYYRQYGVLVALALSLYLMNGYTIRWDTTICTENLYSSSLIILTGILIHAINRNTARWYWILGFWIFILPFIRPNGTYIYFIIPLLFFYFFKTHRKKNLYFAILIPSVLLNVAWATFNSKVYGNFVPGNFIRFTHVLGSSAIIPSSTHELSQGPIPRIKQYSTLSSLPQFYYSTWMNTYKDMYVYNQVNDTSYKMYDYRMPIPTSLRRFVYKEFYNAPDNFSGIALHIKEQNGIRGIWMKAFQYWYKIEQLLFRNRTLFILFALIALFGVAKLIASRFTEPLFLLVTIFGGLHLLSIAVVSITHQSAQVRYVQVSEFIIYVTFALIPVMVQKVKPVENA